MNRQEHKKSCSPDPSRRSFLNRLWTVIGALLLIELTWVGMSIFKSRKPMPQKKAEERIITAGSIDDFKPNTVTAIPMGQFYLACLADGSFLAMSRTCTHLGCSVPWDEEKKMFICPCHGSTFSLKGEVLSAPAPRPLDTFPVRIENKIIKVNISQPRKRDQFDPSQTTRLS